MGLIHTRVILANPRRSDLAPLAVTALVDTGAITLCIPEHVAVQLHLAELEQREVTTAEERHVSVPYVGPVQVTFGNRSCFVGALVLGDGVLLGSIPMEDMDLVINSRRQEVTVNPDSPNIPSAVVKSAACRASRGESREPNRYVRRPSGGASALARVRSSRRGRPSRGPRTSGRY